MRLSILTVPALLAVRGSDLPLPLSNTVGDNDAIVSTTSTVSSVEVHNIKPSVESRGMSLALTGSYFIRYPLSGTRMDTPGTVSCSGTEIGDFQLDESDIYSEEGLQATSEYAAILVKVGENTTASGDEYPQAFKNKESVMSYHGNEGEMWEWPLLSGGDLWAINESTRDEADRMILANEGGYVVEQIVVVERVVVIEHVVVEEVVVEEVDVDEEIVQMDAPCTRTAGCCGNMDEL